MLKRAALTLALSGLAAGGGEVISVHAAATPRYPFPRHVSSAPGTIRPSHRIQAQQDNDVRAFYDSWKAAYLFAAGCSAPSAEVSVSTPAYTVFIGEER